MLIRIKNFIKFDIYILIIFLFLFSSKCFPSDAYLSPHLKNPKVIGSGIYKWFGIKIYKAKLISDNAKFSIDNWKDYNFALELNYLKKLNGEKIAEASIDEINEFNIYPDDKKEQWLIKMKKIFPDVDKGSKLTGLFTTSGKVFFFLNKEIIGEILDKEFGVAFFSIWLSEKTSAPKFRKKLFNLKKD